jgi:hypothetical protein
MHGGREGTCILWRVPRNSDEAFCGNCLIFSDFYTLKMLSRAFSTLLPVAAVLSSLWSVVDAGVLPDHVKRQLPAEPSNVTTIYSPTGVQIRYKEPGKAGICETTEGESDERSR